MQILRVERFDGEVGIVRPRVEKTICINSREKNGKGRAVERHDYGDKSIFEM